MKILNKAFLVLMMLAISTLMVQAQTTKKEKAAAKEAEYKKILESKKFTFTARTANPMRGGTVNLTSEYDVRITGDSVISYLPFFGRAFTATLNPDEAGMKFTSTKFSYDAKAKKYGYDIVIRPTDTKDVRAMTFSLTTDGYGTLSVTSQNRDPITFYGSFEANKKPKM